MDEWGFAGVYDRTADAEMGEMQQPKFKIQIPPTEIQERKQCLEKENLLHPKAATHIAVGPF